jgi:WhiB family transcriptional regulator, redox-sensing transcriptional regulator
MTWRDEAACKGKPTEWWYPTPSQTALHARLICAACPVRVECLDWALDTPEIHGVWGGLSQRQRGRIRAREAAAIRRDLQSTA